VIGLAKDPDSLTKEKSSGDCQGPEGGLEKSKNWLLYTNSKFDMKEIE